MAKLIEQAMIIGGGIEGLCTAIALQQIGIDVKLGERTDAFARAGARLAVWAKAIRALRKLGLGEQVIDAGSVFRHVEICNPSGKTFQIGDFGEPSIAIHWAELFRIVIPVLPVGVLRLAVKGIRMRDRTV